MADISALEMRITSALDRIRAGIEAQPVAQSDTDLQVALHDERAVNAELMQKVREVKDRQDSDVAALHQQVKSQQTQLNQMDAELQNLRASNAQMRAANTQLREAVTDGLAPELVNQAAAAEIAALQAQRSADAVEIETLLAALRPMLEEATHAAS